MAMRGAFDNNPTMTKMASKLLQKNVSANVTEFLEYMKKEYGENALGANMPSNSTATAATATGEGKKKKKKAKKSTEVKEATKEDNQKKLKFSELIRFYIWTLEQQSEYTQIVEEVLLNDEPYGTILEPIPYDRKQLLAEYSLKVEKYVPLSNAIYAHLLNQFDTDEWTWWTGFFDSLFQLVGKQAPATVTFQGNLKVYSTLESAKQFVSDMQKKSEKKRGPFLAMLELSRRIISTDAQSTCKQELEQLLYDYYVKFGTKNICFEDVKPFLVNLSKDAAGSLLEKCRQFVASSNIQGENRCVLNLNIRKIERNLFIQNQQDGNQSSINDDLFKELTLEYIDALSLGTKLEKTQNQFGDDFLVLATHYLLDCEKDNLNKEHAVTCILLLEVALKRSSYNFQIKCLLMRLYSMLEIPLESFDIFLTNYKPCGGVNMDIKHIQWETLSYLIYYSLSNLGITDRLGLLSSQVLNFYKLEHSLETADLVLLAYRNQTFSKVSEFIRFGKMMDKSFMVHVAMIDEIMLNVTTQHSDIEKKNFSAHIQKKLGRFPSEFSPDTSSFSRNDDINLQIDYGSKNLSQNLLIPSEVQPESHSENEQIWEKFYFLRALAHATNLVNFIATDYNALEEFISDLEKWKSYNNNKNVVCAHLFDAVLSAFSKDVNSSTEHITEVEALVKGADSYFSDLKQTATFVQRDVVVLDILLPQWADYAKQLNHTALLDLLRELKKTILKFNQLVGTHVSTVQKSAKSGSQFKLCEQHATLIHSVLTAQDRTKKTAIKEKEWNEHVNDTLKRMNDSLAQTWSRVSRVTEDVTLNLPLVKF